MKTISRQRSAALAALLLIATGSPTAPGFAQDQSEQADLDDRLAAVERALASLDTRLDARTTTGAGSLANDNRGLDVTGRVQQLERELAAMTLALQRLERQLEAVTREAADARRTAMAAERLAQQNATRVR